MPKPVSSSSRFRKSGLAGSLLAVAAGTAAVMTANAQIYYSGLQDLSVYMTGGVTNTQLVDLTGSGGAEFALQGSTTPSEDLGQAVNFSLGFKIVTPSSGKGVQDPMMLSLGTSVGSSSFFNAAAVTVVLGPGGLSLKPGTNDYVGFTFNPSSTLPLYGWGQFSRSADGNTLTLVDWAYDTTGASILTGAGEPTPEPTTLALGATGLALAGGRWYYRRRDRHS